MLDPIALHGEQRKQRRRGRAGSPRRRTDSASGAATRVIGGTEPTWPRAGTRAAGFPVRPEGDARAVPRPAAAAERRGPLAEQALGAVNPSRPADSKDGFSASASSTAARSMIVRVAEVHGMKSTVAHGRCDPTAFGARRCQLRFLPSNAVERKKDTSIATGAGTPSSRNKQPPRGAIRPRGFRPPAQSVDRRAIVGGS